MSENRKVIVRRFIKEVWTDGRIDACDTYLSEFYTIRHDPGDLWDGQKLDIDGFKERVRRSRAPCPDQKFEVQEMFADNNAVIVTWKWSATHKGDIAGFPATGKRLFMSGATVYYFDDRDRIAGHWQIADRLSVFRQLQEARAD